MQEVPNVKVMVVDDEKDVQLLFTQRFRREIKQGKIELSFAFSAEEALAYLNHRDQSCITVLITDINMPGMSGLELLKIIKATFASLRVIMITAYSDPQNYQQAMAYGADDYINKPIEFDMLKQKILDSSSL